jgi:succinate dehydrogenase / fumarate reductase membrane anchor subunit
MTTMRAEGSPAGSTGAGSIAQPDNQDRLVIEDPRTRRKRPSQSKRGTNFEMYAWVFMRMSGLLLVALVLGHLFIMLLLDDGVRRINFGFVAGRWASPFWRTWDLVQLWLAMLHGTNGLRVIINDYAERDGTRFWLKMLLYTSSFLVLVLGTLVIFTFDPISRARERHGDRQGPPPPLRHDHRRRRRRRHARALEAGKALAHSRSHQALPDPLAHRRGAGRMCAALANVEEDNWEWHTFDTVKGGDYLVDQDAAEVMCKEAIDAVLDLEKMGLPFNRTPEGRIDQRRFGGHTRNHGEAAVRRSCFAATAPAT